MTNHETDQPTVTFGPTAVETIIEEFGWTSDPAGVIVDGDGTPVTATDGGELTVAEFGGVVSHNGTPTPIRGDFNALVEHVQQRSDNTDTTHGETHGN